MLPESRPRRSPSASSGGTLLSGTYSYKVTAVLSSGGEVPGTVASLTIAIRADEHDHRQLVALLGASSYNVYGRDGSGVRLLKNVTGTSYVDTGPTKLTDNPLTLPSATIMSSPQHVELQRGANTIAFGASGPITCTGTTARSFTGCSGGAPGQYPQNMPVYSASTRARRAPHCRSRSHSTRRPRTRRSASC